MIKVFLYKGNLIKPFFAPFAKGDASNVSRLFQDVSFRDVHLLYKTTESPEDADYLVVPYNYFTIRHEKLYWREVARLSKRFSKRTIVFAYGDSDEDIPLADAIIVRTSQYRYKKKANEIIMPAYVEDIGSKASLPRIKPEIPVIGFVGQAGFASFGRRLAYYGKVCRGLLSVIFHGRGQLACLPGLYFRRRVLGILSRSRLIIPRFILRRAYSGHKNSIELSPQKARQDFISSLIESDISLAIKGDGNYSLRFYEILSAGRIPVLVDTDCVLPLENLINYDDFIIKIPFSDIRHLDRILKKKFDMISESAFIARQERARKVFVEFLDILPFYTWLFRALERKEIP